jgi:hypothetical protein
MSAKRMRVLKRKTVAKVKDGGAAGNILAAIAP